MSASDRGRQLGSALLVAVGASAALAVLASWVLLRAATEHEAAVYRVELQQARLLVGAVLRQLPQAVMAGELALPAPDTVIVITNGLLASSEVAVTAAVIPSAPVGQAWPRTTSALGEPGGSSVGGVGARLEIRGSRDGGTSRRVSRETYAGPRLFLLRATVWFRRARAGRAATLVLRDGGDATLLE